MKAVVQRVSRSSVSVGDETTGHIDRGVLVFLGVDRKDTSKDADWLADKIAHLRIFEDHDGKMNRSLIEMGGSMLVVSQFTLLGDCRKGRRPSFVNAADPGHAEALYTHFVSRVSRLGIPAQTGQFRATMQVELINDGPVTLIVESPPGTG